MITCLFEGELVEVVNFNIVLLSRLLDHLVVLIQTFELADYLVKHLLHPPRPTPINKMTSFNREITLG